MSSSPKFQMSTKSNNSSSKDLKSWIMDKDVDPYSLYYYLVGPSSDPFKPIVNNSNDEIMNNDYSDYYLEINHMDIENQDSFTDDEYEYDGQNEEISDSDSGDEENDWMFERY